MTSSLRVGDQVGIAYTRVLGTQGNEEHATQGVILAVDTYGVRLKDTQERICFIPWHYIGIVIVVQEGELPKKRSGLGAV